MLITAGEFRRVLVELAGECSDCRHVTVVRPRKKLEPRAQFRNLYNLAVSDWNCENCGKGHSGSQTSRTALIRLLLQDGNQDQAA